jgi:cytochrome c peroxidase
VVLALGAAACGGGQGSSRAPPAPAGLSLRAEAGKALFFDVTLSASGRSCGTCHVPERAFTADLATDQGLPVPLGGRNLDLPGLRNAPSLRYAALTPPYTPPKFAGGQAPTLEAAEIDDVVAFLCRLTDGFDPNNPAAYEVPAQCLPGAP